MKFTRILACLTASLVGAAGLAIATNSPASAQHHHFTVVGPAKLMAKEKKIFGRMTYNHHGLLGVNVAAYLDGDLGSTPISSALSYDYTGPEGTSRPGAFALRNLVKGTYTIVFSKKGFISKSYTDVLVSRTIPRTWLGDISLTKPSPSTTKLTLSDDTIKQGDKTTATVRVTPDRGTALGKVQLFVDGKKFDSDTLVKKDGGKLTFPIAGLSRGSHTVKASYAGTTTINGSDSKSVGLTVAKKARH
jgi:hypothetical protein